MVKEKSFKKKRMVILGVAKKHSKGKGLIYTIHLGEDVVSKFLKELREYQKASKKIHIIAKVSYDEKWKWR